MSKWARTLESQPVSRNVRLATPAYHRRARACPLASAPCALIWTDVTQILECNNFEKLARQTRVLTVFDVSQRGDWNNTRNETVNGKPCHLKGTILEELPKVLHHA